VCFNFFELLDVVRSHKSLASGLAVIARLAKIQKYPTIAPSPLNTIQQKHTLSDATKGNIDKASILLAVL
jgi:hypothetical protein